MTAGSSVVKMTAKTALKTNWLKTIVSCVVFIFGSILCSNIAGFFSYVAGNVAGYVLLGLMLVFMLSPVFLGLIRFIWRMLFGADDKPVSVFYYFSEKKLYIRAVKLAVNIAYKLILIGFCLYIPSVIVNAFSGTRVYELIDIPIPLWTSNLYYLALFLRVIGTVILLFVMIRYYIAPILVVADDNMEVAEAMHMSSTISKNTSLDFIYLIFSMLGWILLSVLVFPLIFTLPYLLTSLLVHVRFAVAEYNKHIQSTGSIDYPTYVAGV